MLTLLGLLGGCAEQVQLDKVKSAGELHVATRDSLTAVVETRTGYSGFEHELVQAFADSLGVRLVYTNPPDLDSLLQGVAQGDVAFAAAGLTVLEQRKARVEFSRPYDRVKIQLVYRRGERRPRSIEELAGALSGGAELMVKSDSSHELLLKSLKKNHPDLQWKSLANTSQVSLLRRLARGEIDFTLADSNELAIQRRFQPKLAIALDLSQPQGLAWAFRKQADHSLLDAANRFLAEREKDHSLRDMRERYYRHANELNFVESRAFWRAIGQRLPKYRKWFEKYGAEHHLDWRLLAAVSYQESHWKPDAVSATGVSGLMMLTQATATDLGINDRTDPQQSIAGGARYLQQMLAKIPDTISGPDRLWLALAGYNIGRGHLEDARILTQRQGGNPDRWVDVKQRLPLLSRAKYHRTLKHGFARGGQPVHYVENVRNFHELLTWYDEYPSVLAFTDQAPAPRVQDPGRAPECADRSRLASGETTPAARPGC